MTLLVDLPPIMIHASRLKWGLAAAAIIAIAAGAVLIFFSRPVTPAVAANAPKPSMTVTSGMARTEVWPMTLSAPGAIMAWQETVIGAQIGGLQLLEVRVNIGDRVKKDQVLAVFDPVAPRAELARLNAALEQAEAMAAQANANHNRAESLSGSGAISAQEVLRYATEANTAVASAHAARAAVAAQVEQLRYVEVRAPSDGVIVARAASHGAIGAVGEELFRMIPHERLEWRGELTAAQLSQVAAAQSVTLSLPDGGTATALVRQTSPSLDPQTRMGLVYADLTDKGSARAGMYVDGKINLPSAEALTVPASGVVLRDGRHYVFTINPAGEYFTVRARQVTPGRRQGNEIELLGSPIGPARIVVTGAGFLKDGDIVRETPRSVSGLASSTIPKIGVSTQ